MTTESDQMSVSDGPHRVPDVPLQCAARGIVSPAEFAGHELIVLFLPIGSGGAGEELREYGNRLPELEKLDAWLLAVCDPGQETPNNGLAVVHDLNGVAWEAMADCSGVAQLRRDQGAAFVIGRGGSLQKVFSGSGHAAEVLEELRKRR